MTRRRPNELLIPLKELSLKQLEEAATRLTNDNLPSDPQTAKTVSQTRAGGVGVQTAPAPPRPPRRRPAARPKPLPRPKDVVAGWGDLLSEISASARRVRVARGGHIGSVGQPPASPNRSPPGSPRTPRTPQHPAGLNLNENATATGGSRVPTADHQVAQRTQPGREQPEVNSAEDHQQRARDELASHTPVARAAADEDALPDDNAEIWSSYRIDTTKVPDSVLATFWRRAVDPKACTEDVPHLERVPRLNITKRNVEQLPAVYDIQHWCQVNRRRKEQRKAKEEAEQYPSLNDMLTKIFGSQVPPQLTVRRQESGMSIGEAAEQGIQPGEDDVRKVVEREMLKDAFPVNDSDQVAKQVFLGVMKRGRRNAFDEGQPWVRGNAPLAELRERKAQDSSRRSRLLGVLEAARGAAEADRAQKLNQLAVASKKVHDKCASKVKRMHTQFLRKQGTQGWHAKAIKQHMLYRCRVSPAVLTQQTSGKSSARPTRYCTSDQSDKVHDDVLRYLKRHRYFAEKQRKSHHAVYLQQVERFQGYLRLLADPNRAPELGEIYLTECFRYVLAAGLIVDNEYFFRVLSNVQSEEFEKIGTVNLLAACCQSFDIDLQCYRMFLEDREIPLYLPNPRPDLVRGWEDWAPWNGVDLRLAPGQAEQEDNGVEFTEDNHVLGEDSLPFTPVVPDGHADDSDMLSRDDPLAQVLQNVALDMVLHRYGLTRANRRERQLETTETPLEEIHVSEDETPKTGGWSNQISGATDYEGQANGSPDIGITVQNVIPGQSATAPSKPLAPRPRGGPRRFQNSTLGKMRGATEAMADMLGAQDKDRPRAAAQAPAMASIAERPLHEFLE